MQQKQTQSVKKALEYFNGVVNSDSFNNTVWDIRMRYFPERLGSPTEFDDTEDNFVFNPLAIGDETPFLSQPERMEKMEKEIDKKIFKKYALNNSFASAVWHYILYGMDFGILLHNDPNLGLCKITDLNEKPKYKLTKSDKENELASYPLVIKISPYASERDMLDFVRKEFTKSIKPILQKYRDDKIRLGAIKVKNDITTRRNLLIWSLRDKPRKEIMQIVHEKTGQILDQGHIGKIISLEKQKRKQV